MSGIKSGYDYTVCAYVKSTFFTATRLFHRYDSTNFCYDSTIEIYDGTNFQ